MHRLKQNDSKSRMFPISKAAFLKQENKPESGYFRQKTLEMSKKHSEAL